MTKRGPLRKSDFLYSLNDDDAASIARFARGSMISMFKLSTLMFSNYATAIDYLNLHLKGADYTGKPL